jgi:phosphomannomutase
MASKSNLSRKVLSVFLAFILLFTQTGFAQVAAIELNLSSHFVKLGANFTQNKFRLPHLRYFSYDNITNNIQLFLDKGDLKDLNDSKLEESSQQLLKYFLIGVTLPDDNFWVNLRPDSENNVISDLLAKTDIGKIFLGADVQLKKDTAQLTSPETAQGKIYWDKLYQKANQIYGTQNVNIPTLTRPWIVPGEIIIRETQQEQQQGLSPQGTVPVAPSVYIYKATLNVLLEQDHLKDSVTYNFEDNRAKELNEYSSQLIRELILPGLTKKVNNDKAYASLRQVYYSLILARWFKARFYGKGGLYASYINKSDLKGLTSQENWSTSTYFKQYQDSFNKGEYNLKTTINTLGGPSIRSYFSGGISMMPDEMSIIPPNRKTNSSPIQGFTGKSNIAEVLGKNIIQLLVTGDGKISLKTPYLDTPYVNNKKKNGKLLGILSSNNQQLGMRPYLTIDSLPAEFLNDHAQISVYQNFGKNDPDAKPLFIITTDPKRGLWIPGLNIYQSDFSKLAWEYRTADGYININYLPNDKSIQLSLHFTPSRRPTNEFFQVILEPSSSSPISSSPVVLTEQTSSFMYQGEPIVTGQLPQEVLNLYNDPIILKVLSKKPTLTGIKQVDLDPAMAKFVKYGTSGDRDVVYDEDPAVASRFNVQRVLRDAQGIASYYKTNNLKGAVRLGYETRLMAREYAYLTAAVLAANGIRVKLPANAVPLPSLAFSVADSQEANDPDAGGIMITASHNPWQWLGIKWLLTNGGAAPATVTEPLERITKEISTASIMSILEARNKGLIVMVDYRQDYINYILNNIPAGAKTALKEWGSKENNKVISNPVQGGAIGYVPQILEALGIRYEERNNTIDRMFAGSDKKGPNPDYAPDFDNNIAQAHKQGQNILEIMQDVDADRFGVRDVNGIRYTANELIPMYKWFLRTKGYKGAIGKTIPTSDLSNAVDEYWGDTTLEVDTGFKNLVDSLESDEVIVAGEESAHVGIGIWKKSKDDGIAVGLLAVWIVAETGKSLTEYKKEIESTIGAHFKYRRIDTPYKGTRRQAGAQMLELINLAEAATVVKRNNGKFNFEYKGNEKEFSNLPIINEKIIPVAEQYGGLSKILICYDPLSGKSSGYKMVFADNSVVTVRVSGTGEPVIRTYIEIVTPCTNETWDKVDAGSDARWQELANKSRDAIGIYRIEDSSSSPVNFQDPSLMIDTANAKPLGNLTTKKRYSSFSSTMEYISSEFVLDPIPGEFTNRDARIAVYETFEDGKTKNDLLLEVRCEKGGVVWVSGPNVHHYNLNEWEYKMGNTQIKITHDSVNKTIRFTALDSNVKQYRVQNFQVILEPISSSPVEQETGDGIFYEETTPAIPLKVIETGVDKILEDFLIPLKAERITPGTQTSTWNEKWDIWDYNKEDFKRELTLEISKVAQDQEELDILLNIAKDQLKYKKRVEGMLRLPTYTIITDPVRNLLTDGKLAIALKAAKKKLGKIFTPKLSVAVDNFLFVFQEKETNNLLKLKRVSEVLGNLKDNDNKTFKTLSIEEVDKLIKEYPKQQVEEDINISKDFTKIIPQKTNRKPTSALKELIEKAINKKIGQYYIKTESKTEYQKVKPDSRENFVEIFSNSLVNAVDNWQDAKNLIGIVTALTEIESKIRKINYIQEYQVDSSLVKKLSEPGLLNVLLFREKQAWNTWIENTNQGQAIAKLMEAVGLDKEISSLAKIAAIEALNEKITALASNLTDLMDNNIASSPIVASSPIFMEEASSKTDAEAQKEIDSEFAKINNTILDKKVLDKKLELLYGYWKNGFKVDLKEVFSVVYIVEDRYVAETFEQMGMHVIKHPDSGYAAETVNKIIGELRDYNDTSRARSLTEAARKRGLSISSSPITQNEALDRLKELAAAEKEAGIAPWSEAGLASWLVEAIASHPSKKGFLNFYEKNINNALEQYGQVPNQVKITVLTSLQDYTKYKNLLETWANSDPDHNIQVLALAGLHFLAVSHASSSPVEANNPGGIDFRSLPMTIQPIGSFRGLNFSLPQASTIAQVNIDKELAEISKMVDTGIMPNGERVKELIAACYHKQELANHQQELMSCLIRICKLEEEMVVPTGKEIKEALVIVDSIR